MIRKQREISLHNVMGALIYATRPGNQGKMSYSEMAKLTKLSHETCIDCTRQMRDWGVIRILKDRNGEKRPNKYEIIGDLDAKIAEINFSQTKNNQ